jgi:Ca2+-binding EF-hand superfamily protein
MHMVSSISSNMGSYSMPSLKEMQQKMFQKADADGDGQISKTELSSIQPKGSQNNSSSDDMFSKLDSDADGAISRAESDAAIEQMRQDMFQGPSMFQGGGQKRSLEEMQEEMFTHSDSNGDGSIDASELSTMAANGPEGGPSAEDLLAELDTDGNGTVSRAESDAGIERMQEDRPPGPPPPTASDESSSTSGDASDSLTQTLLDALNEQDDSSTASQTQDSDLAQMIRNAMKSYMQAGFSSSSRNGESLSVLGSQLYA